MGLRNLEACIRPFLDSAYEVLDERFAETGDVVIWSVDPLIPRLGDHFTIESGGELHDVGVYALSTFFEAVGA